MRFVTGFAVALGLLTSLATDARATPPLYDWLQFGGDPQHSGNDTKEAILSPGNVGSLTRTFSVLLPSVAAGAPAVLTGVSTPSGTRDLLFVTTLDGHAIACDAHSGAMVWSFQFGPGACLINNGTRACTTPSSPAVDPNRAYVYTYGLDGNAHKLAVGNGAEVTTGGWPEVVSKKPFDEQGASALAIATAKNGVSYLYVTSSAYSGDGGDYQGHLTVINLSDGSQHVFNSLCSDQTTHFAETPGTPDCSAKQSGIWARSGAVYDADNDTVYVATGNGNYAPSAHQWGDSVLALHPDGTGGGTDPIDTYTPTTFSSLQAADQDLGSTAPVILHPPASSKFQHLALQSGKDGQLRLLNLDNLSGQGGPGHTGGEVATVIPVPQGSQVLTAPASWNNPADGSAWAFVANASGIAGLRVSVDAGGNPSLVTVWQSSTGGTSPVVANGVLYYASSNHLFGLSPTTGAALWNSTQIGTLHWESPVVANGMVYVTDQNATINGFGGVVAPSSVPAMPPLGVVLTALALLAGVVASKKNARTTFAVRAHGLARWGRGAARAHKV